MLAFAKANWWSICPLSIWFEFASFSWYFMTIHFQASTVFLSNFLIALEAKVLLYDKPRLPTSYPEAAISWIDGLVLTLWTRVQSTGDQDALSGSWRMRLQRLLGTKEMYSWLAWSDCQPAGISSDFLDEILKDRQRLRVFESRFRIWKQLA